MTLAEDQQMRQVCQKMVGFGGMVHIPWSVTKQPGWFTTQQWWDCLLPSALWTDLQQVTQRSIDVRCCSVLTYIALPWCNVFFQHQNDFSIVAAGCVLNISITRCLFTNFCVNTTVSLSTFTTREMFPTNSHWSRHSKTLPLLKEILKRSGEKLLNILKLRSKDLFLKNKTKCSFTLWLANFPFFHATWLKVYRFLQKSNFTYWNNYKTI